MDDGPFRMSRSGNNRPLASRPEPAAAAPQQRQPEQRQAEHPAPVAQHRAEQPPQAEHPAAHARLKKDKTGTKKSLKVTLIIGGVLVVVFVAWFFLFGRGGAVAIDGSKYQAVFFTNGQVYFGKLEPANGDYMKLSSIYYLQTQAAGDTNAKNPQQSATSSSDVELIKLGDEIHGPEDEMIISKDQILFYENLKPGGKVAQSIEQHKKANNK